MRVQSLRSQEDTDQLSDLFRISGAIIEVIAISAYIDIKTIDQLIKFLKNNADSRRKVSLKIFIDRSSSRFFSDIEIRKELIKREKKIQKLFSESSSIFLVRMGKLFHSKAYLIEGNREGKVLFGSMNLTQKGINENEEILLSDSFNVGGKSTANGLAAWLKEYSERLEKNSTPVTNKLAGNYSSCLRHLLLDGKIYYELKEQDPFRFPLNLPEDIVNQRAEIDPLLESNVNNTISLKSLIKGHTENGGLGISLSENNSEGLARSKTKKKERPSWKKYCIVTCYGYWNPTIWNKELIETLDKRRAVRELFYKKLFDIIKNEAAPLKTSFIQLCERIDNYLYKKGGGEVWKYSDIKAAGKAWDKWYANLIEKLDNKDFCKRLSSGVASVPSPDVWDDPLSSEEFERTFCESIIYCWSKEYSRETRNVIAQAIAQNLDFLLPEEGDEITSENLKRMMEKWMGKNYSSSLVDFQEG